VDIVEIGAAHDVVADGRQAVLVLVLGGRLTTDLVRASSDARCITTPFFRRLSFVVESVGQTVEARSAL
jgi:hypothetical protein